VPRLSIIIPHRLDDAALEQTILSVLENKPSDTEIIVVHNGTYADPYHLEDEVLLIRDNSSSEVGLINAGLLAATAPVVCLLCNGATVHGDRWAEIALQQMQDDMRIVATSPASRAESQQKNLLGIDLSHLSERPVLNQSQLESKGAKSLSGPRLCCGFYRRKVMTAIGGWNESVTWTNADIEMAMLFSVLGLRCELSPDTASAIDSGKPVASSLSDISQMAALAVAYGLHHSGFGPAVLDGLRGLSVGKPVKAIAWANGILSSSHTQQVRRRCQTAREQLQQLEMSARSLAVPIPVGVRRAA